MQNFSRKKTKLLIDAVTSSSPGMLQLQLELSTAAARHAPDGCEVILLQSVGQIPPVATQSLTVIHVVHPGSSLDKRWGWYNITLPRLASELEAQVVYSLSGILSPSILKRFATISTVNNMLPFTEQLWPSQSLLTFSNMRTRLLRQQYVWSLRRADWVFLHSHHALKTISQFTGNIADKTTIVHTGIPQHVSTSLKDMGPHPFQEKPYLFYLSAMYPYKNHLRLIDGYRLLLREHPNAPDLIFAGLPQNQEYVSQVDSLIRDPELKQKVKYIGAVELKDIPSFLHHAVGNVFPSLCETNSVVLAEIIGVHGVLAVSDCAPMPEICGNAAVVFNPFDSKSIANTLKKLCFDEKLPYKMRRLASERAKELSWERCGQAIWRFIPKALSHFQQR